MRSLLFLVITSISILSCSKSSIQGSGSIVSETRTVQSFDNIQAEGSINVEVINGTSQHVEVSGYENLVPIFETFVSNGTLVLKFRKDYYNIRNNNIKVIVETPAITNVGLNGSGEIFFKNMTGNNLSVEVNGSGDVNAFNCIYTNSKYKVNGSGNINATSIAATNVEALVIGSGEINVHCIEKLNARVDGSGEINYWGNPSLVDTRVDGSGHVRKK